ncbi:MAG: hypothetical protein F6K35_49685, partial [Okeania sp. SIO2H7]|nr:hypothetical protein [Okeania sp. SIO2H7]
ISAIPLPDCAENSTRLTRNEIQELVLAHNRARKEADQYRPSNTPVLPAITWDCAAAEVAQQYANETRGTQGHSNREWRNQQYSSRTGRQGNGASLGENLAWNVASSSTLLGPIVNAVTDWIDERSDYNHDSGTCSGGVCGHYTQIIWRESTGVGCGVERDSIPLNGTIWPHGYFLSCNYHHAGNINGDNPLIEHPDWYYE